MKQTSWALLTFLLTIAGINDAHVQDYSSIKVAYPEEKNEYTGTRSNDLRAPRGCPGPTGPTGSTGPMGDIGFEGRRGATGPQGLTGIIGPEGNFGAIGLTGSAGFHVGIAEFAYFAKNTSVDVNPQSPFDFNFASTLNTANIIFDPISKQFNIGTAGTYLVNYIVTPIGDFILPEPGTPMSTGFTIPSIPTVLSETIYKIQPFVQLDTPISMPVMRGQFIRFFPANTTFNFVNLSTTSAMHFDSDISLAPFAFANVASIIFIKLN